MKPIHHADLNIINKLFFPQSEGCKLTQKAAEIVDNEPLITSPEGTLLNFEKISKADPSVQGVIDFSNATIDGFNKTKYYYINNPDGTIRWIYPATNRHPSFLTLYNAAGLKAKLIKNAMKGSFRFGMKSAFASGQFYIHSKEALEIEGIVNDLDGQGYSIFTGTVGKNRKCIIEINQKGQTTHFVKYPLQENSAKLVQREKSQLNKLNQLNFRNSALPVISPSDNSSIAILSNVKPSPKAVTAMELQDEHLNALEEWYDKTHEKPTWGSLNSYQEIEKNIQTLKGDSSILNDLSKETVDSIIGNLEKIFSRFDKDDKVFTAITHTDFTPWNMYVWNKQIHIYDWELSRADMPLLFDAFHFIFQSGILIKRSSFEEIQAELKKLQESTQVRRIVENYGLDFDKVYQYYLLFNISYYTTLYIKQKPLHMQAHWLMETWDKALKNI